MKSSKKNSDTNHYSSVSFTKGGGNSSSSRHQDDGIEMSRVQLHKSAQRLPSISEYQDIGPPTAKRSSSCNFPTCDSSSESDPGCAPYGSHVSYDPIADRPVLSTPFMSVYLKEDNKMPDVEPESVRRSIAASGGGSSNVVAGMPSLVNAIELRRIGPPQQHRDHDRGIIVAAATLEDGIIRAGPPGPVGGPIYENAELNKVEMRHATEVDDSPVKRSGCCLSISSICIAFFSVKSLFIHPRFGKTQRRASYSPSNTDFSSDDGSYRSNRRCLCGLFSWKTAFYLAALLAIVSSSILAYVYVAHGLCYYGATSVIPLFGSGGHVVHAINVTDYLPTDKYLNSTIDGELFDVGDKDCAKITERTSRYITKFQGHSIWHDFKLDPANFANLEIVSKDTLHVLIRINIPWGSNLAVYGRRNVVASITQYDFSHFIKSGRLHSRIKRDTLKIPQNGTDNLKTYLSILNDEDESSRPSNIPTAIEDLPIIVEDAVSVLDDTIEQRSSSSDRHIGNNGSSSSAINNATTATMDVDEQLKISSTTHYYHANMTKRSAPAAAAAAADGGGGGGLRLNVTIPKYFSAGTWYLSVYNDDLNPLLIKIATEMMTLKDSLCPNNCSGHGICDKGKCECDEGFGLSDCSDRICPLLCSGNGRYAAGFCLCEHGWKGNTCDTPTNECEIPNCSGHGTCIHGSCVCDPRWKGHSCEIVDCFDPNCSENGKCVQGECYCKAGWKGATCAEVDDHVYHCIPRCSNHGTYDMETGTCTCNEFWTGENCSQPVCNITCKYGICLNGVCECDDGWDGPNCDQLPCDYRCRNHGQCKNGTCVCQRGWNGRHCTIPGCGNDCNKRGECVNKDDEFYCRCMIGWTGYACAVKLEQNCENHIDDDRDGLIDCADTECCTNTTCTHSPLCLTNYEPDEVLLRKQPASDISSFFQKTKFLIEERSVQSYAHLNEFSERRVSVVRGVILTRQGTPVNGVRVSVDQEPHMGFTLTRKDGWFDLMLNGGYTVILQIQRSPYKPMTLPVYIPWNVIKVIPAIVMEFKDDAETPADKLPHPFPDLLKFPHMKQELELCKPHDIDLLNPQIITTWTMEKVGGNTKYIDKSKLVYMESRVLQERIRIPGTKTNLLYRSSLAPGYLSYLLIIVTGPKIPSILLKVYVHVEVEGCTFTKTLEPDANLTYTFTWNKRNFYKQRVYGISNAKVSIGYYYATCDDVMWEIFGTTMKGFEVDNSVIGGWGLDIHHHYNFHEGILQKGDGHITYMNYEYPRILYGDMGVGLQRQLDCLDCEGKAYESKLLMPVALASDSDGNIYVGDFNMVRKIGTDGIVYTLLKFSPTQVSYNYYLCMSPYGRLFVSDAEHHRVLRIMSLTVVSDPFINYEIVAGTGDKCVPGDLSKCGDNGPAIYAQLSHPKGIAVDVKATIYIADGINIRAVGTNGIIHTVVGHNEHTNMWKPLPCHGAIDGNQVQLQWPTAININPVDHTIHIIDDRMILKLTQDNKIKVVAGTPLHCYGYVKSDAPENIVKNLNSDRKDVIKGQKSKANDTPLGSILSMAFSPTGELYLAESNSHMRSIIKVVDLDGFISDFAGQKYYYNPTNKTCKCLKNQTHDDISRLFFESGDIVYIDNTSQNFSSASDCYCLNMTQENVLSPNAKFLRISAMTVTPDNVLHIADQGSLRIVALHNFLPQQNLNGEYEIAFPATSELYFFNRYGQHVTTKHLQTGKTLFTFTYSRPTSFGKLSSVTDDVGNRIHFLRDYMNFVIGMETSGDINCQLNLTEPGLLNKFSAKGIPAVSLSYNSLESGLLISRIGGSETLQDESVFLYDYDEFGRLKSIIYPTGEMVTLDSKIDINREEVVLKIRSLGSSFEQYDESSSPDYVKPDSYKYEVRTSKHDYRVYTFSRGYFPNHIISFKNGSFLFCSDRGEIGYYFSDEKHPLLESQSIDESEILSPIYSYTLKRGESINSMIWQYELVGEMASKVKLLRKSLRINKDPIFMIDYNRINMTETVYGSTLDRKLMYIEYNKEALPLAWKIGNSPHFINITYDPFNRINSWSWGFINETFKYNNDGLLIEEKQKGGNLITYEYDGLNKMKSIKYSGNYTYNYTYDNVGGISSVILPSGAKHLFSAMISIGFIKFRFTPALPAKPIVEHYSYNGMLTQRTFVDRSKILYRYLPTGQLSKVVYGSGSITIKYCSKTGLPISVEYIDDEYEYRSQFAYDDGLLTEQRIDFPTTSDLSNAKFMYEYDNHFRLSKMYGRIGGQTVTPVHFNYDRYTGKLYRFGEFSVRWFDKIVTISSESGTSFKRVYDEYNRMTEYYVYIHTSEVFKEIYKYDDNFRLASSFTKMGLFTQVKNYTYDSFGQLVDLSSADAWSYEFDRDGNMISMAYKGNRLIVDYQENNKTRRKGYKYKYNERGYVVENIRKERFHYNERGYLINVSGINFNVFYFYDHFGRLSKRHDSFGNITQFFYSMPNEPNLLTQAFNPKDGKMYSFLYDDRKHLISIEVFKNRYHVATDHCGTPKTIFNQYGEVVKDIMRSPYGHIIYDSNPYVYLVVDFYGGILDPMTTLVHMPNGKVYDPLVGQWMTPIDENILKRVYEPKNLQLYRFNHNDPVNVKGDDYKLKDEKYWLSHLGYDMDNLLIQFKAPASMNPIALDDTMNNLGLEQTAFVSGFFNEFANNLLIDHITLLPTMDIHLNPKITSLIYNNKKLSDDPVRKTFCNKLNLQQPDRLLETPFPASRSESIFGRGITLSKTDGNRISVNSMRLSNVIYRDVITTVLNNSEMIPYSLTELTGEDAFYFVKPDKKKAAEDKNTLHRLGPNLNVTINETAGLSNNQEQMVELHIYKSNATLNIRYSTTYDEERERLIDVGKSMAMSKLWQMKYDALQQKLAVSPESAEKERKELANLTYIFGTDIRFRQNVLLYPELSEDPSNLDIKRAVVNQSAAIIITSTEEPKQFERFDKVVPGGALPLVSVDEPDGQQQLAKRTNQQRKPKQKRNGTAKHSGHQLQFRKDHKL